MAPVAASGVRIAWFTLSCVFALLIACAAPAETPPSALTAPPTTTAATSVPATDTTRAASAAPATDDISGDVVVFAAASLTESFQEIAGQFKQQHPGTRVLLSFGGSSQLAIQLVNGARPDVFASADQDQMDVVERGHQLVGAQQVFVRNRLMVIAPIANPASISSLQDLARPGVKVIGAQASVPIGDYTTALLKSASANPDYGPDFQRRVERNVVTRDDTVRQIVSQIQLGEGDAAVVYTTDVTPQVADQFVRIPLPDDLQIIANYPIAVANGHNRAGGQAFVAYVESPPGQEILAKWGFLPPPTSADR
jgi:molybdate transport system substrate-binding protein